MTDRNGPGDDLKSLLRLKNWLIAINTILLIVLMGVVFAWAGPLPQPKLGATCPAGYEASGNYCRPNANTRCRAMPKIGATCPNGYTASGGAYCIETGCQTR